jgi:hypothetical protein
MKILSITYIILSALAIIARIYKWRKTKELQLSEIMWILNSILWCLLFNSAK